MTSLVPAVDLGGTHLRVGIVDVSRLVVEVVRQVRTPDEPADFAGTVLEMLDGMGAPTGPLGIAAAPEFDSNGVVRSWPSHPCYVGTQLLAPLRARGFKPTILDDGAAAALATHPGDRSTTVFVGLGTGVAGGVVVAGSLFRGKHGVAMDVGHMQVPAAAGRACACGRLGCLQAIASAVAVAARCRAEGLTLGDLPAAYSAGEAPALLVTDELLAAVAEAMTILAAVFDPDRIVLDAGLLADSPFVEAVAAIVARTHPHTPVARPALPAHVPLIGAAIASKIGPLP